MIGYILFPAESPIILKIVTFFGVIVAFFLLVLILIVIIAMVLRKETKEDCMHKSAGQ